MSWWCRKYETFLSSFLRSVDVYGDKFEGLHMIFVNVCKLMNQVYDGKNLSQIWMIRQEKNIYQNLVIHQITAWIRLNFQYVVHQTMLSKMAYPSNLSILLFYFSNGLALHLEQSNCSERDSSFKNTKKWFRISVWVYKMWACRYRL
jgi:hypothetical protein